MNKLMYKKVHEMTLKRLRMDYGCMGATPAGIPNVILWGSMGVSELRLYNLQNGEEKCFTPSESGDRRLFRVTVEEIPWPEDGVSS